jgi:hypothetical protein
MPSSGNEVSGKTVSNPTPATAYQQSVFINCPFDDQYKDLFDAVVFAVVDCGFTPRCALEITNSGQSRIDKIVALIRACQFGIHDLSRTELDPGSNLPRFNMPFEFGIFFGAQRFGTGNQKKKNCLIFDHTKYRYQQFISDIAGQDIATHDSDPRMLIVKIRDWLNAAGTAQLPGGPAIANRYDLFRSDLPAICRQLKFMPDTLTFPDLVYVIRAWLKSPAGSSP